jgi:hypothetical protein
MTIYQDYLKENILKQPGLVAWWPMDDPLSLPYARVLTPGITVGKNVAFNGTFDTDTVWTKGTGWTIAGGVAHCDGTGGAASLTQPSNNTAANTGHAYTFTYTISNYVSGSVRAFINGNASQFTLRNANGTYTETVVVTTVAALLGITCIVSFVGDIDNIIVTELNIPPVGCSYSDPTLIVDGTMESAGTASWTAGNSATLSKQTGTPHGGSQVLRIARNGVSSPYAGQTVLTVGQVYRAYGYMRSDGSATPIVYQGSTVLFTGTTSTSWQTFDVVFVATATDIRFGTSTNTGTQYVEFDDATVTLDRSLRLGEIIQDGDMETAGTGVWVAVNSATLTKDTGSPHAGTQNLRVARNGVNAPGAAQSVFVIGKKYRITCWVKSDGSATPRLQDTSVTIASGTTSTSWQLIDTIYVATTTDIRLTAVTSTGTQFCEFDDLSITEVHPMVGLPVNGVVQQSPALGHLLYAYNYDGTNDLLNAQSVQLNAMFNPNEGTVIAWIRVSAVGIWTDGVIRTAFSMSADGSNIIQMRKQVANNTFLWGYTAGGTVKTTSKSNVSTTDIMMVALTWSKTADQVIPYFNGNREGSILTGLGTWTGNLATTGTVIGATSTVPASPWSGKINDVRLYSRALSAPEILREYRKYLPQFQTPLWR